MSELKYDDFSAGDFEDKIIPTTMVSHKKDGYLVVQKIKDDGKYLCCKKGEANPSVEKAQLYEAAEISQYVCFKLKIFNVKELPTSVMNIKLKIEDPVSKIEVQAKAAFVKVGALMLAGKKLESKQTLLEAGIVNDSEVTSAMGAGIKYKEKRD